MSAWSVLFIVLAVPVVLLANDSHHYQQGQNFATQNPLSLNKPQKLPGDIGAHVPEAQLSDRTLQTALQHKMREKDNAGSFISKTHDERSRFNLNPSQDPLFTASDAIVRNPLTTLKAHSREVQEPVREIKTRHTCQEGGEPYTHTCTRKLHVEIAQKKKNYKGTRIRGSMFKRYTVGGNPQYSNPYISRYLHDGQYNMVVNDPNLAEIVWNYNDKCNDYFHRVDREYEYTKGFAGERSKIITAQEFNSTDLTSEDIKETWTTDCDLLESKVDQGLCAYADKQCTHKGYRTVGGFNIYQPCWQEAYTYRCSYPAQNTCSALKYQGCIQIKSLCKKKIENTCVLFEQTYECTERQGGEKKFHLSGSEIPWCLDGNCASLGYAPNKDMAEALSKLMIFREIQKDMKDLSIFKGDQQGCHRHCVNFKDCCGTGSGWGISVGLSSCSASEKALAKRREQKQCIYVGTYCAEKFLGTCLRKKSNFCCFGSKFARLIQEQGRKQLGLSFGEAEYPLCRGFTTEELSRMDFDKINLSELFTELFDKLTAPNVSKLSQDFQQDWKHRIPVGEKNPDSSFLKNLQRQKEAQNKQQQNQKSQEGKIVSF